MERKPELLSWRNSKMQGDEFYRIEYIAKNGLTYPVRTLIF